MYNQPPVFMGIPRWRPPQNNIHGCNFQPRGPHRYGGRPHFNRFKNDSDQWNSEYWCETCDRGFKNKEILENHKAQHQKCNIDGCQFIAHPKVITKHIQMQHSTGLYKKIATSDDPEDIKKWIEERKRKYPTKKNIEQKAAERKEKFERGEKMGLDDRRNKNCNKDIGKRRKNNFNYEANKRQRHNNMRNESTGINNCKKQKSKIQTNKDLPSVENRRKLKPFAGIQNILMESDIESEKNDECNLDIEDDSDKELDIPPETQERKPLVCGALSSLICNYESSGDEVNDLKVENCTNELVKEVGKSLSYPKAEEILEIKCNDDESGPEEVEITKQEKNTEVQNTDANASKMKTNKKQKVREGKTFKRSQNIKRKLPSTLLEKLLSREIVHERNIILQCVRYIVKQNFFDSKA